MSTRTHNRSDLVTTGLGLIGLALLLESRWVWPGILFLLGTLALVRARSRPAGRDAARSGVVLILLGVWALLRFSLPSLMLLIGVGMIATALLRPRPDAKPYIDHTLD